MITDVMREARTEYEVYFLLTSYIEAVRSCERSRSVPEQITALPIAGKLDVRTRYEQLIGGMDSASQTLDDDSYALLREALDILGTALNCLWSLDRDAAGLSAGRRRTVRATLEEIICAAAAA